MFKRWFRNKRAEAAEARHAEMVRNYAGLLRDYQDTKQRLQARIEQLQAEAHRKEQALKGGLIASDSRAHQAMHHYRIIGGSILENHKLLLEMIDADTLTAYLKRLKDDFGEDAIDPVVQAMLP